MNKDAVYRCTKQLLIPCYCRREKNLRRMNTAVKLNQIVRDKSSDAQLVVINLPGPPKETEDWQNCILQASTQLVVIIQII